MTVDVLVVGAGIGGLTTALALAGEGHRVTVAEQAPRFEAVGAGIVLAPNAVHVLAALRVDLAGAGQVLGRTELRTAAGRMLSAIDLQALTRRRGPSYGIARPALHALLADALLADALPGSVEVLLGTRVETLRENGDGVSVGLPQGDRRFDVVVGADGLRSAVRGLIAGPGAPPYRYSGTTCWRGTAALDAGQVAGQVAVEAWGDRTRVGVVPIGADLVYYYLVRTAGPGAPGPASVDELRSWFAGYDGAAGRLLQGLTAVPPLHHDLVELDRPFWGRPRVLLLGDAAHAMTPNQGQGAAMAIEDAVALTTALRGGIAGALDRYSRTRGPRVRKVQLTSRRIGVMAHWHGWGPVLLRDAAMRLIPESAGIRAVDRLVAPGVALAGLASPS